MLEIIVQVKAPIEQAVGVKEQICMELEKFGDVKVVSIKEKGRRSWKQEEINA